MTIAAALEREHRDIDGCVEAFLDDPAGAGDVLRIGLLALRQHIYLEEVFLFPPLRAAGLEMPVQVMLTEHGELWRLVDAALAAVDRREPEEAAATSRQLLELLDRHNSKEEPVIYPRADVDLSPQQADELDLFIGMGELPAGWVCERA
jgi:iron-sulfur cluster repair protein YtfE (RIC family)